jgi:signal peptidase I
MEGQRVVGASMNNTFHTGDYILTSKISYRLGPPKRGDIIVFKSPRNPDIDYIKRIIGLPGDRIRVTASGDVFLNGNLLTEPYIADRTTIMEGGFVRDNVEVTVPEEHLFVMGDNRPRSSDSRDFGFIPESDVIGKVFFRYLPFDQFGPIVNHEHYPVSLNFSKNSEVSILLPFATITTLA